MKHVLPDSWTSLDGAVTVGGVDLLEVARRFGTPALVTDRAHLDGRLSAFREAFGNETVLVYAGKAFLCGALVQRLEAAGWWVDVVSRGELEVVSRSGLPPGRVLMHGNAPPHGELRDAVVRGVGRVVVDHPGEVAVLGEIARETGREVRILVRLNAELAAVTHDKVRTTGARAQFGMDPETARAAVGHAGRTEGVAIAGVHIHAGSQIRNLETFRRAAAAVADFVEPLRDRFPERVDLDLGGGMPVPYLRGDAATDVRDFAEAVLGGLVDARAAERVGDYRLLVEPGRSVIATSTVTLYRVEARKRLPDGREVVAVDGGLSDNPRPSLYGQRYEMLSVSRPTRAHETPFHAVGRHCETGDVINENAPLPAGTAVGDVVAVPATGAYAHSMSSRYNGLPRPPVVWVADGVAREVVRRETIDDLIACDAVLNPD